MLFRLTVFCAVAASTAFGWAQESQKQKLDRQYQEAVGKYEAGQYAEAATQLEGLLPYAPDSFAIHEMLGLSYASLSQEKKALGYLETAVRLQPDSAAARTSLATLLSHLGKPELAREQFRKALELAPQDFDANHNLGEFYVQSGKIADALPLLERAQRIDPTSYDNGYDLALAKFLTGRLGRQESLSRPSLQIRTPGNCTICWERSTRKTGNLWTRSTTSRPPRTWTPARATCSIGAASFCCTEPTIRLSKSFRRLPAGS